MSYYKNIKLALDGRLNTLTGSTPIAWDNIRYTPVIGTAFIRPTLLMSPSALLDVGTALQLNQGIYTISLFYPTNNGPRDILDKMDAIYDHFKGDLDLSSGSTTVYIKQIDRSGPSSREEGWYSGSVDVYFKTYQ